ncbi:hypothetical protein [Nostoc sp. DSM 114167]|uniref:hypothetical protein n=1 Tax=Nostoc sp. DSM 114167 TaxID=3439050 RepID=UPI0040452A25
MAVSIYGNLDICEASYYLTLFQETRQEAEGRRQKGRGFDLFLPFIAGGDRRQWVCF